jgi:hypothetical protein
MSQEPLPVNAFIHVIEYDNVYKTEKWWCAVVKANVAGHNKILYYLWQKKDGKWKRKHKASINSSKNWETMKEIIERYLTELGI